MAGGCGATVLRGAPGCGFHPSASGVAGGAGRVRRRVRGAGGRGAGGRASSRARRHLTRGPGGSGRAGDGASGRLTRGRARGLGAERTVLRRTPAQVQGQSSPTYLWVPPVTPQGVPACEEREAVT